MSKLTTIQKSRIEKKVEDILKNYNLDDAGYVDVLKIAQDNDFLVGNARLKDDEDGFIIVNKSEKISKYDTHKIIGVNSSRRFVDKRFIIAHELGHFFLNSDEKIYAHREHRIGKSDSENEYDYFAACLLMPKEKFKEAFEDAMKNNKLNVIGSLESQFKVSKEVIRKRIKELELSPDD